MSPFEFRQDTNGGVEENEKGICVTQGNMMAKESQSSPVDCPPPLHRSLTGSHEAESPKRPIFTYRPKPAFGVDSCASISTSSSFSTSTTWSAPTSIQSGLSSPLSSTCGKSYDSSPTRITSSSSSKGSDHLAVGGGAGNDHDNPPLCENKAGLQNKGLCFKSLTSNGPVGGQKDQKNVDGDRVASWSKYLDSSGSSHYETAERKHMVDMSQLFLGQKFACGTYSRLYRGQYNNREVAVKMVRIPDDDLEVATKLERQFHQEVHLLSGVHHANIIQFIGAIKKPPVFCIITEYLAGGSLKGFLVKNQPNTLGTAMVLSLALDIARGMEYLHSQGVLHLDLKSHNLVLADNNCVKVTDFGVARTQSECESMTLDSGTYRWMAPELISNKHFSVKADVYSFGIILWEIVTGLTPYEEMTTVQAAFAVVHKHLRPQIPDNCPRPLKELMEECWAENPDKRPSFWQIVERLEQFQDCIRCNKTFQSWRREKGHSIMPFLQKFKQVCFACKHLRIDE
ncbi:unnamed protein product [Calypogeia fissa]